ncbi:hypothetical protein Cs7R123_60340 [Catellatospora sp. TT07R-123]|uniref:YihY/virulence factor BrkB family protein n=1 Tax=Catellatospora sp. TT07R-123 TaxID=2733863 RepID=UPI001B26E432|nr:YihY/virulence factor BrkB family protein [Catellatospora sp. TT07R-123]GHJ48692.1 hypothetical protein Cs7R123_60340 [Catellatospora sp. TT07R-123]
MARSREPGRAYRERLVRLLAHGPERPSQLSVRAWLRITVRTVVEFIDDDLADRAAALTYYSVLSIIPGLLVLVAGVGLFGSKTTQAVAENLSELTPGPAQRAVLDVLDQLRYDQRAAGVAFAIGIGLAFWSATSYTGAFMRAANVIYDVPEGRPVWKTVPVQLFVTAVTGLTLAVSALAVVFTGRVATHAGRALGLEEATVRIFDVVKWPVLIIVVNLLLSLLYWAGPNARQAGFRWITPGTMVAMLTWIAASAGFAYYITTFDSYNRTYGALGGVIIFLVWLWLTNVAVLLGAEFDAELSRARAIAAGLPHDAEPYLPLRDVPRQVPPGAPGVLPEAGPDVIETGPEVIEGDVVEPDEPAPPARD